MRNVYLIGLSAAILLVGAVAAIPMASGAAAASEGFAAPMEIGNDIYTLGSLSCTGVGDCTAVGSTNGGAEPAYDIETDGVWGTGTVIPVSEPDGDISSLGSVSCTDALDCTAVGEDPSGQISLTESDGSWGPLTVIAAENDEISSLSCTGVGDCTGVGFDGYNSEPFVITESGGSWGSPVDAIPFDGLTEGNGQFNSVSCSEPLDCTAVGADDYDLNGDYVGFGLIATETDGTWVLSNVLGSQYFGSVSCSAASDCTAISPGPAEYTTESDGTWGPITPFTGGLNPDINAVSCSDALDCTAVGEDNGDVQPIYAIETDGDWGPVIQDTDPYVNSLEPAAGFDFVSCTDATDCTATGFQLTGWDTMVATTFDPGGATTLAKSSGLIGHYVETVSGTGWAAKGDTSVTLTECATTYYTVSSCDSANQGSTTVTKKGRFSNALITLAVGSIDTNGDTCGVAGSNPCYIVVTGSNGDWTSSGVLSFKLPKATVTKTTAVAKNYVDDVTATDFPIGDTVTAQECDSSVNPATNLATNCDTDKMISGTVGATGTVTFSPAGVKVKVGAGYVETGTGTVVKGGTADIVVNDSTTSGISKVIPITLAA